MEILYHEEGVYFLKFKNFITRIKKRPKFYDFYYYDDKIYVRLLTKIKFEVPFKFSELEKFNEND